MKISIDTKEDSHDDIRKAIKLLQHVIGDSSEVFINQSAAAQSSAETSAPFANIFGDTSAQQPQNPAEAANQQAESQTAEGNEPISESTEDLFAELFSEEELKKMEPVKEEEEAKPKGKKHDIELY